MFSQKEAIVKQRLETVTAKSQFVAKIVAQTYRQNLTALAAQPNDIAHNLRTD